jgi:hypothetical protein
MFPDVAADWKGASHQDQSLSEECHLAATDARICEPADQSYYLWGQLHGTLTNMGKAKMGADMSGRWQSGIALTALILILACADAARSAELYVPTKSHRFGQGQLSNTRAVEVRPAAGVRKAHGRTNHPTLRIVGGAPLLR